VEPRRVGRPKCWYRDVSDGDKGAEVSWLRSNVMGPDQAIWALRITARDRYPDRCWRWGESLGLEMECAADRSRNGWNGVMKPEVLQEGPGGAERYARVAARMRTSSWDSRSSRMACR
jgi:hypothetical protein